MTGTLFLRPTVIGCAVVALAAGAARADGPRTELARLVPDEAAVCLVFGDLRGQVDKLKQSAWLKKVRASPLGEALADALEGAKLGRFAELLEKRLDIPWPKLRDEVLGDAVILAYQPGPPGRPDDEQGVLLLQARNPALLAKLIQRLNDVQKKSGELKKLEERQHAGRTYFRRVEGDSEQFYHLDGGLLAFSGHEAMIKRVLERAARPKQAALPPLAEHVRLAGADKALVTLWVSPRALDAELREKGKLAKPGAEVHVFQVFLRYWQGLEGVSLSLLVEPEPELRLALQAHNDRLPAAFQRVIAETVQPSELWSRFPKKSVLTAAGRVDVAALLEVFREWTPPEAEQKFQEAVRGNAGLTFARKMLKEMLPYLGPDCGVCVLPAAGKGGPPQLLAAVRVRPGEPGQNMDRKLYQMLGFMLGLAVTDHNRAHKDQVKMVTEKQDGIEVKYLANGQKFPQGFRPAFALKEGYLVVASSPETIRQFAAGPAALPATADGAPLLRLSLRELRGLLREQREGVVALLGRKYGLPPEAAAQTLELLLGGLELFEDVQVTQRVAGPRTVWLLRLRTAKE